MQKSHTCSHARTHAKNIYLISHKQGPISKHIPMDRNYQDPWGLWCRKIGQGRICNPKKMRLVQAKAAEHDQLSEQK